MEKLAILVTLEAKPDKEKEVEQFLKGARELMEQELTTINWYALKIGPGTYGIFDTFEGEEGRQTHLSGELAKTLMQRGSDLFTKPPKIEMIDLLAVKQEIANHHHNF